MVEQHIMNKVLITGELGNIEGELMSDIQYGVQNDYNSIASGGLPGIGKLLGITGLGTGEFQSLTRQIATGGSYIDVSIVLGFYAYSNPVIDVMDKIDTLNNLSIPGVTAKQFDQLGKVEVTIFGCMLLHNVVIKSLEILLSREKVRVGSNTYPLYATATLGISTDKKVDRSMVTLVNGMIVIGSKG